MLYCYLTFSFICYLKLHKNRKTIIIAYIRRHNFWVETSTGSQYSWLTKERKNQTLNQIREIIRRKSVN